MGTVKVIKKMLLLAKESSDYKTTFRDIGRRVPLRLAFLVIFLLSLKCLSIESFFLNEVSPFHMRHKITVLSSSSSSSSSVSSSSPNLEINLEDQRPSSFQKIFVGKTSFISQDFSLFGSKNGVKVKDRKDDDTYVETKEEKRFAGKLSFNNIISNIKKVVNNEKKKMNSMKNMKKINLYPHMRKNY